jgi:hypothetical protein
MSLGCFVEKPRLLQLNPRKTSCWLAQLFGVDSWDKNEIFGSLFDVSNIQQYNNSRKEGTAARDCGNCEPSKSGRSAVLCPSHGIM